MNHDIITQHHVMLVTTKKLLEQIMQSFCFFVIEGHKPKNVFQKCVFVSEKIREILKNAILKNW